MDEQPTQPQAGEPAAVTPPAGGTSGTRAQASPPAGDDEAMSVAEARKLRNEAANLRDRLAAALKDQQTGESSRQSQLEATLQREVAAVTLASQATERARTKAVQAAVVVAAVDMGINPALAAQLMASHKFDYDDDDEPKDVAKTLKALLEKFPQLAAGATAAANPAGTRGNQPVTSLKDAPAVTSSRLWSTTS